MTTPRNRRTAAPFSLPAEEERAVDRRLAALADRWNPILGAAARQDLVEDVNSLIGDEVHRIKRFLSIDPDDNERIENLTELITRREVFSAVRSREALREYVRLSIVKLLSRPKSGRFGKDPL